jgi:hypothetical protein
MGQLISQRNIKAARKSYDCMASEWFSNVDSLRDYAFTFSEWRAILTARNNGWKILKGEPYIRQFCKEDSEPYVFIAIPAIHAICLKYDYYQN